MKRKSPKQYTERFKKEAINLILEEHKHACGVSIAAQPLYF
ncbi:hypothetical protein AB7303_18825 [Providencia rettgeri]